MSVAAWPWCELDLQPTQDSLAVKKAYAVRLKRTRPDENPDGYQQLRAAYEAALELTRQTPSFAPRGVIVAQPRMTFAEGSRVVPSPPASSVLYSTPGLPTVDRDEDSAIAVRAAAARRRIADFLEGRSFDALPPERLFGELRGALDLLPLKERHACSRPFAQAVVERSQFPPAASLELAAYFGWFDDFRQASLLGAGLHQQVRRALEPHRGLRTAAGSVRDVARARYDYDGDLARATLFAALVDNAKRGFAYLVAVLASPRLSVTWYQLQRGAQFLCGARPSTLAVGRKVLDWAYVARATVLIASATLVTWSRDRFGVAEVLLSLPLAAVMSLLALVAVQLYELVVQVACGLFERLKARIKVSPGFWNRQVWLTGLLGSVAFVMVASAMAEANGAARLMPWLDALSTILVIGVAIALLATRAPWAALLPALIAAVALDFARLAQVALHAPYPWLVGAVLVAANQALIDRKPDIVLTIYRAPLDTVKRVLSAPSSGQWIFGFPVIVLLLALGPLLLSPALALALARMESRMVALGALALAVAVSRTTGILPILAVLLVAIFALRGILTVTDSWAQAIARRMLKSGAADAV